MTATMQMQNEIFSVRDFCEYRGWFEINRTYQRESGVWSLKDKQHLIDTILRNLDIPKIYLGKLGDRDYEVVDGQQRIETVQDFRDGEFSLRGNISGWDLDGKYYGDLSEELVRQFNDFEIHVVVLEDFTDEDIRSMFRKLQRGQPLNWREKLNAYPGSIVPLTRGITEHPFFEKVDVSLNRYRAFGFAARFLLLEDRGPTDISPRYVREFFRQNKNKSSGWDIAGKVKQVLNYLDNTFEEPIPELNKEAWVFNLYLLTSFLIENYDMSDERDQLETFYIDTWHNMNEARESGTSLGAVAKFVDANSSGTTSKTNIETRYEYLVEEYLRENPDLNILDSERAFNHFERATIWRNQSRQCDECGDQISFEEMEAHHVELHSEGGQTSLENAQGLCSDCHQRIHAAG